MWSRKKKELARIRAEFNRKTQEYHGESIWDLREFLMLLNLADHDKAGKSKAIIYAYELGYISGKKNTINGIERCLSEGNKNYELGR